MRGIKYIGEREAHIDNLYGTGLTWAPGEVHNVSDEAATKMVAHTDVYEEVKPVKGEAAAAILKATEPDPNKAPLPNLEGMDKVELQSYAQQHYGLQLHHRMTEANMRAQILSLIQSKGR